CLFPCDPCGRVVIFLLKSARNDMNYWYGAHPSPFSQRETGGVQAEAISCYRSTHRRQLGIALLSSSTPQVPFFMGRLRQRTGITPPSSLAMTGISSTEPLLRPFVIARPVGFRPRRSPDVIEAPAAGGDCFTQGKHIPSSFFHGTREAAYRNYSPSSLAMTGISGMELTLRLSVIARLAGFPAEAIS